MVVILYLSLAALALLSLTLALWQLRVGCAFPLHQRRGSPAAGAGVTLLKPLKGADAETEACMRTWFT